MKRRVVVDTSVWIAHFKHADVQLQKLLLRDEVATCPPIIQEILQGITGDEQFEEVKELLDGVEIIDASPKEAAIGAAALYRHLRKQGISIRKPNDCLIAWYAMFKRYPVYHADRDFEAIKGGTRLKTIQL